MFCSSCSACRALVALFWETSCSASCAWACCIALCACWKDMSCSCACCSSCRPLWVFSSDMHARRSAAVSRRWASFGCSCRAACRASTSFPASSCVREVSSCCSLAASSASRLERISSRKEATEPSSLFSCWSKTVRRCSRPSCCARILCSSPCSVSQSAAARPSSTACSAALLSLVLWSPVATLQSCCVLTVAPCAKPSCRKLSRISAARTDRDFCSVVSTSWD
mmetsp:Transcript_145037/g.450265  ORF Transcript_145037/g.450265 Transcript_145037/m.450265 type:complete len:225 (-) Transcript_145037:419-1093(-)